MSKPSSHRLPSGKCRNQGSLPHPEPQPAPAVCRPLLACVLWGREAVRRSHRAGSMREAPAVTRTGWGWVGEMGLCPCLRSYLERLVVLLPEPGDLRPSQCILPAEAAPIPLDRLAGDGRQQQRGLVESGPVLLELGEKDTGHSRKENMPTGGGPPGPQAPHTQMARRTLGPQAPLCIRDKSIHHLSLPFRVQVSTHHKSLFPGPTYMLESPSQTFICSGAGPGLCPGTSGWNRDEGGG